MRLIQVVLNMTILKKILIVSLFVTSTDTYLLNWKSFDLESVADYIDMFPTGRQGSDIRSNFIKRKIQKEKLKDLERLVADSDTVVLDGISHYPLTDKAVAIEKDFKELLAMKSMKYTYKRQDNWKTWRETKDSKGKTKLVCYKCQNTLQHNKTDCGEGYWVIEENPPCTYEIYSVIDDFNLCASNYSEFNKVDNNCPLKIKYMDLTRDCSNPIYTLWRFTRNYRVPERNDSIICKGRDFCEISTVYHIQHDQVTFRVINNTNVIYSRVMRENNKNYACVEDCGLINLVTLKVKPNDSSLILNLLPNKEKRHSEKEKTNNFIKNEKEATNKIIKKEKNRKTGNIKNERNNTKLENGGNRKIQFKSETIKNEIDSLMTFSTNDNDKRNVDKINDNDESDENKIDYNKRYVIEGMLPEVTAKSRCKKIIEAQSYSDEMVAMYDSYEILRQ